MICFTAVRLKPSLKNGNERAVARIQSGLVGELTPCMSPLWLNHESSRRLF